jgi:hypothetical protein
MSELDKLIPRPDLPAKALLAKWHADKAANTKLSQFYHASLLGIPWEIYQGRITVAERAQQELIDYNLGKPMELEGDAMVVGDVHVPYTDYEFAQLVGLVGKKHLKKPRKLIVAGDFFSMDSFSLYTNLIAMPTWAQERNAAKIMLSEWLEVFDTVEFIMGNHDRRIQRFAAGAFETTDLLSLIGITNPLRVRWSNFSYCTLKSGDETWHISHPRNYSVIRLHVAEQLALKYNRNVISFHEHFLGMSFDRYGRHIIVNGGALVDPGKLAYAALDDSKSNAMIPGFVIVKDGIATPLGKSPYTEWRNWL